MTGDVVKSKPQTELRKRAKARLERETVDTPDLSPAEVQRLVYELRTHQIELEMQNEELRRTQSELIESRDRYSDLYDYAPVGYVSVNHKGLILDVNLTLARMLGIERTDLVNRPFSAFIIPGDQDVYYLHRRNIAASGQHDTCVLRMIRRNADPFWVDMSSNLSGTDDGNNACLRTVISDVTERIKIEAEKLVLERQLQHAQKLESLGVLAGGIAHDFNNLLAVILGNADLALLELTSTSPARVFIQEIGKTTRRAAGLAAQMLTYSGKGRVVVEPIDIREIVDEIGHMLEVSLSKKAVLKFNFGDEPAIFNGDATQIRQVVMNLITNASEAIGDRSGIVTLSVGTIYCDRAYIDEVNEILRGCLGKPLPEGKYVYLEVADTGCGMEPEIIERIFDPFFTTKFKGRGLGMSAILGIMQGHGGGIRIDSKVGEGTTFTALFPANSPHEETLDVQSGTSTDGQDWRGEGTILLAEDDEKVRKMCKRMLEHLGFDVITAADGREALQVFSAHAREFVCVLLDLTMPHMDGEEAFREMRRIKPDVTAIVCSGFLEKDVTERFDDSGLAGFIQKPFDLTNLRTVLMQVLCSPA